MSERNPVKLERALVQVQELKEEQHDVHMKIHQEFARFIYIGLYI